MHTRRFSFGFAVAVLALSVTPASADMAPAGLRGIKAAEEMRATTHRRLMAARKLDHAKVLAVAEKDPRFAQAKAELAEAVKSTDPGVRSAKLKAIGNKYAAARAEWFAKARVNMTEVERKSVTVKPARKAVPAVKPSTQPISVTINTYPESYSYKHECPDSTDTWKFTGERTEVHASSIVSSLDCMTLRAGRGGRLDVPAGVKRIEVTVDWVYEINTTVANLGAWGRAVAETGVRFHSAAGATLDTVSTPSGPQGVNVRLDTVSTIVSDCVALPFCTSNESRTARETFFLDVDRPGLITITPYVDVMVDADLTASSSARGHIKDIRPISVKMYR